MNLLFLRRVASTRLFCLAFLAGAPCLAMAQDPAPPPANVSDEASVDGDEPGNGSASASARFGITLDAPNVPKALRAFVLKHLELQRFRTLDDLNQGELDRLLADTPDDLRDLLGTQGYFSPTVSVSREPSKANEGSTHPLGEVRIHVELGPLTLVTSSNLYFKGDITESEAAASQRQAMQEASQDLVGQPFTQSNWDHAKSDTLRLLTAERYPRGRIVNSLSDIDSASDVAHWHIELDSGAPVTIGGVRIEGAERYPATSAERLVRLAGLRPGADYSLAQLQDAQQKIADTGYYTSVFAYADLDDAEGDNVAPVVVQVKEALPQKVVLGVGGSTNNGPRISAEHTHLQLPGIGWRARSKLQLERKDQLLSSDWNAPVEEKGWHWGASGSIARQIDNDTTTSGVRLSLGRAQESTDVDRRYFVQYDRARTVNPTSTLASSNGNEAAVSANYGWTWRHFDNMPFPDKGYGLGLTLGVGTTLGTVRKPFVTTHVRWLGLWPLGNVVDDAASTPPVDASNPRTSDQRTRLGRLALRLQGGAVMANAQAPIPATLLFLTGGDNTVRGYGLRDIGVVERDGSVTAGRYLTVASFEWQRPVWRKGVRTDWESVVFVDAGAVANRSSDLKAKLGVGAGVRYISPVGPLQLDLAYGVDIKRFRIHLNIGFNF